MFDQTIEPSRCQSSGGRSTPGKEENRILDITLRSGKAGNAFNRGDLVSGAIIASVCGAIEKN